MYLYLTLKMLSFLEMHRGKNSYSRKSKRRKKKKKIHNKNFFFLTFLYTQENSRNANILDDFKGKPSPACFFIFV